MGKYRNIFFSEAIALIEPKLCINHQKVLCKLCVFYVDRNSKMTTTAGHSFYIGPIGSFYNQVNDTATLESLWYVYGLRKVLLFSMKKIKYKKMYSNFSIMTIYIVLLAPLSKLGQNQKQKQNFNLNFNLIISIINIAFLTRA